MSTAPAQEPEEVSATSLADYENAHHLGTALSGVIHNILRSEKSIPEKLDLVEAATRDARERLAPSQESGLLKSLGRLFGKSPATNNLATIPEESVPAVSTPAGTPSFTIRKDATGKLRWLGVYSNHYLDKEGDIFTADAHAEFEKYLDQGGSMPELWLWHVPGSRVGTVDMVTFADGFAIASGTFDVDKEYVASTLAKEPLAMSHGAWVREEDHVKENGVGLIKRYRTREVSVLPRGREANPVTFFINEEGSAMPLSKEKRDWLASVAGDDLADRLDGLVKEARSAADAKGLIHKEEDLQGFAKEVAVAVGEALAAEPPQDPTPPSPNPPSPDDPVLAAINALNATFGQRFDAFEARLGGVEKELHQEPTELRPRNGNDPRKGGFRPTSDNSPLSAEIAKDLGVDKEQTGEVPAHMAPYLQTLAELTGKAV